MSLETTKSRIGMRTKASGVRHLAQCDFASPAKDGLIDLLISVDNADLHYSFVDVRGKVGEPVARLGPLGWTCIGPPDGRAETGTRTHTI